MKNRTKEFHDLPPGYKHMPKGTVTKTKWLFLSLGLGLGFSAIGAGALWVKMTEPPAAKYKSAASTIHPTPTPIIISIGPDVDIPPCLGQGKDCMEIEPDRPNRPAVPFNKQPDPFGRNYDDKGYGGGWGHGKNNGGKYYGGRGDGDNYYNDNNNCFPPDWSDSQPVPEPGTILLITLGLGLLAYKRKNVLDKKLNES